MANLQKIKDLAEKRQISIRELAEKVGLRENQLHVICRTNSTKIDTLEKIAHALHAPISCFFDDIPAEQYEQIGNHNLLARQIDKVEVVSNHNAPNNTIGAEDSNSIMMLRERIKSLETLLAEKERLIQVLMQR